MSNPRIQTVTGAVPVSVFEGPVLPDERLRTDTRWGIGVASDPTRWLDEERYVTDELRELCPRGLQLVVDQTSLGQARDAAALARISAGARVAVVAATGFCAEPFAGDLIRRYGVDDLTADLLREIGVGLDGSSSRPGLIAISAHEEKLTPAEERATIAVARASVRTGLPVAAEGLGLLELLLTHGVPAARISVRAEDALVQRKVAESGSYVSVTQADDVLALLDAGHGAKVLLGSGVRRQGDLKQYGGAGFARVFDEVLPALEAARVDQETIRLLTQDNPLRWLTLPGTR